MGRKTKVALSYFPLDCDFFSNRKVKALRRAHGQIGLLTYVYILCRIYANGYYLKVTDLEQFAYDVAEDIANDHLASVSARVTSVISYLADIGLLCKACLAEGVLTGKAIQEQYIRSITASKRTAQIKEYSLTDSAFPIEKNGESTEEKNISSEEIAKDSERTGQTKQNKNDVIKKYNKYILPRTREEWTAVLDEKVCLENVVMSCEAAYGSREAFDLVLKELLNVLEAGQPVTVKGTTYEYKYIAALAGNMERHTLGEIVSGFYEADTRNMRWIRKQISSPRNYILSILIAKAGEMETI